MQTALPQLLPLEPDPEPTPDELALYDIGRDDLPEPVRLAIAKSDWRAAKGHSDPEAFLVPFVRDEGAYNAYRSSPKWKRIRKEVLKSSGGCCLCCGGKATQVHHRDYRPRVLEGCDRTALVPICKACHDDVETARKESWQAGERRLLELSAAMRATA